jgi:hypothetical protein
VCVCVCVCVCVYYMRKNIYKYSIYIHVNIYYTEFSLLNLLLFTSNPLGFGVYGLGFRLAVIITSTPLGLRV